MTDTPPTEQATVIPLEKHMQIAWDNFTDHQRQFVIERLSSKSDVEAARRMKIHIGTVNNWSCKKLIDQYVAFQRGESLKTAKFILVESTLEAVGVLRKELHGKRRLTAAKEILDRAGLPAITRQEVGGVDGNSLTVEIIKASDAHQDSDQ